VDAIARRVHRSPQHEQHEQHEQSELIGIGPDDGSYTALKLSDTQK
jgi:hypothetical protein